MEIKEEIEITNTLTVDGVTYKTSGNIVFEADTENPFIMAQSTILEKLDCFIENGMRQLLKKADKS
ncbi:MAG: hypothetical protein ABIE84_00170 [bacterium]